MSLSALAIMLCLLWIVGTAAQQPQKVGRECASFRTLVVNESIDLCQSIQNAIDNNDNGRNNMSKCIDVIITATVQLDDVCVISFPSSSDGFIPYGDVALTIRCDSSSGIGLYCTRTANTPCFRFTDTVVGVPGVNVSVSIIGCTMYRAAVEYNIMMGTLRMENVTLNGMGTHLPLNVFNAMNVTIQNSYVLNGANTRTFWMGGGCVSLRGVRVSVMMFNTTIRNCNATRFGGCVYIT
eukprot:PhF_6_TR34997/c1_g3_i3/m.50884